MNIHLTTPLPVGQSFLTILDALSTPRRSDAAGPDLRPYPPRLGEAFIELISRLNPDQLPDHGSRRRDTVRTTKMGPLSLVVL